jgi:competence protein ComEC
VRTIAAVPATGLLAGAASGLFLSDPHSAFFHAALVASLAAVIFAWALGRTRWCASAIAALFFAGGVMLGADAWQRAWRPPLRIAFEQIAERDEAFMVVEGVLRRDASPTGTGVSLSVDVDVARSPDGGRQASGGILVTVVGTLAQQQLNDWRAGRRVRMPVVLRRPSRYLDPGVPDHERELARRGTTLVGTVKSGALVEVVARGGWIDEHLAAVRAFARRAIAESVGRWSDQSAAIVAAIAIGDRAGLQPDVQRRLQEAGTYHVIAISGGNIAILVGLLLSAFRVAGWLGRSAMLASIALVVVYARLVGGGASVDRATLMAVVYLAGRAFDQRSPPLNTLAFVAALLVGADPLSVVDPAFILTFGATLAIVVVVPVARVAITPKGKTSFDKLRMSAIANSMTRPLVAMFVASVAAEAMLFPVGALVFSRVTIAGLALNFVAIPLMAVAQIAGMAVVPIAVASHAAAAASGWIAHLGADGLVRSADLVRLAPVVTFRVAPPPWPIVIIYYIGLAAAWSLGRRGARRSSRAWAVAATIAALWILGDPRTLVAARGDGQLHVTFIDVGQGDSAFVRFPQGRTLLVDAGGLASSGTFDIGDRVVAPVIRDAAFHRLDYVALTHGDPDHIGGALSIVREFRPREVWEGIPVPRFEPLMRLRMAAQASGARWANVYAGSRISIDGVDVIAHHPSPADWERQKVRNDDSLVLELRWREVSVLLTGDIGKGIEHTLAAAIPATCLRVLKVPHHGSLTSSTVEFIEAVHPTVAVFSVGRGNHFGHPVAEVVERYRQAGAEIFRTDVDGAVMIETDGASMSVHTFTGRTAFLHETHENTKRTK